MRVILVLLLATPLCRPYHRETVDSLATSRHTHVEVCGTVTLAKWEADGDRHIRVSEGGRFIVAEIVPYHPLTSPKVGQRVCVDGIRRDDTEAGHGWWEIHPVEKWRRVK